LGPSSPSDTVSTSSTSVSRTTRKCFIFIQDSNFTSCTKTEAAAPVEEPVAATNEPVPEQPTGDVTEPALDQISEIDDAEEPVPEVLTVLSGPDQKVTLPIVSRTDITHDTAIFKLKLPSDEHTLGYPVGYHIRI
jgi:hypothetical protein